MEHALGEFAQEDDINARVDRGDAGVRQRRAHRREQVELLAHRRHHPSGVAARIGGVADRPHDLAVELAQRLLGHRRKRIAVLLVPGLAAGFGGASPSALASARRSPSCA
jgi:hypothetical protein